MPGRLPSRLGAAASLLVLSVLLSSCGVFGGPQNTFSPAGEIARDQKNIFLFTMWPALLILVLVEGILIFILIRFRRRKGDPGLPAQVHGNNALEIGWTIAPLILLAFFVPPTIHGIVTLGKTPKDAMKVEVTGLQWVWQFDYPDPNGGTPIQAPPNELHIPVNRDIGFTLKSTDVIHSFWMPRLAGKTDVIPGRLNHMWINADQIGTFSGQCAEFCGLGHAQMRFKIVVQSQADFDAWLKQQAAAQHAGSPALAFHGD
ncbi:MAG TPA: cytochrome c oxidase subunit II [Dehalococcoidia bacterium]|nr:cytochrome c oxidase subunit II [Dehalococcoidia bacterium]